jgi:hypothetical protein
VEFYVPRSDKRQLETNIISGAANAFSLAASSIEKPDENIARNTLPGAGKPRGKDRINRRLRDSPLFLTFPGTSYLATLIGVPPPSPFHEKTRRRVDYGGQAGTNLRRGKSTGRLKLALIWARQRSVAGLAGCGCSCADRL